MPNEVPGVPLELSKREIQILQNILALFIPTGGGSDERALQYKIYNQTKVNPSQDGPYETYKTLVAEALDDVEGNVLEYLTNHMSLLKDIENSRRKAIVGDFLTATGQADGQ
jgi:hypothetical protein